MSDGVASLLIVLTVAGVFYGVFWVLWYELRDPLVRPSRLADDRGVGADVVGGVGTGGHGPAAAIATLTGAKMTARHGHVLPNPSGTAARCGGPAICADCASEQQSLTYELRRVLDRLGLMVSDAETLEIITRWAATEKALQRLKGEEGHG